MALEALQKMSSRGKGGTTVLLGESITGFALILERDPTGLKWRKWKEKFDLAILDIMVPKGSGFDILKYINDKNLNTATIIVPLRIK